MSLASLDPSYSPHAGTVCAAHGCTSTAWYRARAYLGSRVPSLIDLCNAHLDLLSEAGELEVYVNCPCGAAVKRREKGARLCPAHEAKAFSLGIRVAARGRISREVLVQLGIEASSKVDAAVEEVAKKSARTGPATTPATPRKPLAKPVRPAIASAMTAKAREGLALAEGVEPVPGLAKVVEAPTGGTLATPEPQRPTIPDEPTPVDVLLPDLAESERDELNRLRAEVANLRKAADTLDDVHAILDWANGETDEIPTPKAATGRNLWDLLVAWKQDHDVAKQLQPDIEQVGVIPLGSLRERLATFLAKSWTADLERDLKTNLDVLDEIIWVLDNVSLDGPIPDYPTVRDSVQKLRTIRAYPEHHPARRVLELIDDRAKAVIAGQAVRVQLPVPLNGAPTIAVVLPANANGDPVVHVAGSKRQVRLAMDALNSVVTL